MRLNIEKQLNRESTKHGTFMLPYSIYRTLIPEFYTDFPLLWHEEIEIIYVVSGTASYTVDFEQYLLHEGDILIIPPTALHSFKQHENCSFFAYLFPSFKNQNYIFGYILSYFDLHFKQNIKSFSSSPPRKLFLAYDIY